MFLEILTCVLHGKIDVKDDAFSSIMGNNRPLLELLPKKSRDFVRWSQDRLEHLTKSKDKDASAVACEMLAVTLLFLQSWDEDHGGGSHSPFRKDKDIGEKTISKILDYLRRAVELDPSRERAWEMLTPLLVEQAKYEEAAVVARKRIARKDNAHNRFFLAKVYAEQKQFDKAAEQLRIGLKQEPEDLDCRLGLIAMLLKRDDSAARKEAGEQLGEVKVRKSDDKSKSRQVSYSLLRGIHAALSGSARPSERVVLGSPATRPGQHEGDACLGGPRTTVDAGRRAEGDGLPPRTRRGDQRRQEASRLAGGPSPTLRIEEQVHG